MRAEGWARVPIVRMSNVSILPGEKPLSFDELIGSTDDGIYMETNRSWSIDDKRYNFQFGCEVGWEIKGGKLGRMLRNPSYSGIRQSSGTRWMRSATGGTGRCGGLRTAVKGNRSRDGTGHGAAPARFRLVKVGGAYG